MEESKELPPAPELNVDAIFKQFILLAKKHFQMVQALYLQAPDPAYEKGLDSLGMVARHAPVHVFEALLKWRESNSPKGAHDASTFRIKLAAECIFCSACIRIVDCCPQEVLPEVFCIGMENYVFDWLINAERIISQAEYPSLVDLRSLLLDIVAQLLGSLSRIRFNSVCQRFLMELNARRINTGVARSETLYIIDGMRYLKLGTTTKSGLNASSSFVLKANPLYYGPRKRKSELLHALCSMLSSILAPLVDAGKRQWPPSGVGSALALWYENVARIRDQVLHWMDKKRKHIAVGYPLVTLLLCLGDPQTFRKSLSIHMEQLYKYLPDKNHHFMALDCLHRVVRFYLSVYADNQPQNRVQDFLDSVTSQLLVVLRKGMLTRDVQLKLVELYLTIAESNIDLFMNHLILELLKPDSKSEAKVIGLRSLHATLMSLSNKQDDNGIQLSQVHDIGYYIPKVKFAIESILRSCHRTHTPAPISPKITLDAVTKENSQGYVFISVLKCGPYLIAKVGRSDKKTGIISKHSVCIDPEEALKVLNRINEIAQSCSVPII